MKNLSPKQQAFIDAYLGEANLNAAEAARLAGYKGRACNQGYKIRHNPNVAAWLQQALKKRTIPPEEVISRLSDIASASLADFTNIDPQTGKATLDLRKAEKRGLLHIFESIETTEGGQVKVKRYSSLQALNRLARLHQRVEEQAIHFDIKVLNVILDALPSEFRNQVVEALGTAFPDAGIPAYQEDTSDVPAGYLCRPENPY